MRQPDDNHTKPDTKIDSTLVEPDWL